MTTFSRLAAVLVGLANLAVLVRLFADSPGTRRGAVAWDEVLPPVIVAMVAGLVVSEIGLRWFRSLALTVKFFNRYVVMVGAVCFGGTLMGGMLAAALVLNER